MIAGGIAVAFAVVVSILPSVAAPLAAAAIRDAVRADLPETAEVEVSVSLGWRSPLSANVEVRDGSDVEASLAISTDRGMSSWIGPVLGGSVGEVPLAFTLVARLEGNAGRAFLDHLRREESATSGGSPAAGDSAEPTETATIPAGLSILAAGSIDLTILDQEDGIDLAVDSERVEVNLLADRTVEGSIALRVGRVADADALPGRLEIEGSLSNALVEDGSFAWPQAEGAVAISSSALAFDWDGRAVSIDSLRASGAASQARGISLAAALAGAIDGAVVSGEADLAWRSPFAEDGSLRGDLAGLGGLAKLSGMPTAAVASFVPAPYDEVLRDLGPALDAEIAVPTDAEASLVARLSMDRLRGEATARLDRETGEIAAGAATLSLDPTMGSLLAASGLAVDDGIVLDRRVPITVSIDGIELLDSNDLRIARGEGSIGAGDAILRAMLPNARLAGEDSIGFELASLRWRIADGVPALEARGMVEVGGELSIEVAADRPPLAIADSSIEWFAEPLGKALSLRARAESEGAVLRFEERFDGLWTGRTWLPITDLRPHGNLSIDGLSASRLEPWIPEAYRPAFAAQDLGAITLQLGTRVEGDRLEGALQIASNGLSLTAPISLDSQRLAIGEATLDATPSPAAFAALPDSVRGGWRLLEPTTLSIGAEPIVFALPAVLRGELELPPLSMTISSPSVSLASGASDDRIVVEGIRLALRRAADGSIDAEGSATMPPFSRTFGDAANRVIESTRPFVASARVAGIAAPESAFGFEQAVLEWSPIELLASGEEANVPTPIAAHRAAVDPRGGESLAIVVSPLVSPESGAATLRFTGLLGRIGEDAWALDGEGAANGIPAALASIVASDGGLVERALGDTLEATIRATALSGDSGEVALSLKGPRGRLDLPRLLVEPELLRIPLEPAFSGQFAFSPNLVASLADLNPMLGQLESMEEPIRIRMWECAIPRAGVGLERLDGQVRVDFGRGRFVPNGVLERILVAFGDANAEGFDGFADPLIATIRGGQLSYENFAVRFVPFRDGWRNTLNFAGRIDLARSPAFGEFTAAYPASSLAAYSAEIRKMPPDVLAALTVPMTLYGPLDGSDLKLRIDFDFGKLIEEGVKAGVREGARRLFEDLLGPKK
ncbi:MAG: hypothetical protein ACO38V_08260 [Phycisphaerales bacterium]